MVRRSQRLALLREKVKRNRYIFFVDSDNRMIYESSPFVSFQVKPKIMLRSSKRFALLPEDVKKIIVVFYVNPSNRTISDIVLLVDSEMIF